MASTSGLLTQYAVETLHSQANQRGRVTQETVEVLHSAANRRGRVTQETIEVLHSSASRTGRSTQIAIEVIHTTLAFSVNTSGSIVFDDFIFWQTSTSGTQGGLSFTTNPGASSIVQGVNPGQFNGNFQSGETLFWTSGNPITITFASGITVAGIGTQIQPLGTGMFFATLQTFDVNNTLLGTSSVTGNMTSAADGSAPFIGVKNNNGSIHKATLSVTKTTGKPDSSTVINYGRLKKSASSGGGGIQSITWAMMLGIG